MIKDAFIFMFIFIAATIGTTVFERVIIPVFKRGAKQPIYEGGPSWHMKKSGTPTMGGVGFLIPFTLLGLLLCIPAHFISGKQSAISLFICISFSVLNALIGLLDDLTKLRHKENKGLTAKEKLFLQTFTIILFLFARASLLGVESEIYLFAYRVDLGILYYPILGFILLGIINCANLTDGIDGLAASVAFSVGISLFYLAFPVSFTACVLCALLIGCTAGFLIFNIHPAKIFMGDTGSLFLGAAVASAALEVGGPVLILSSSAVYIIEGVSVILQVAVFKLTKKRIFKMAPLHHHLEKCGWSENKICISAIFLTLLSAFIFLFLS